MKATGWYFYAPAIGGAFLGTAGGTALAWLLWIVDGAPEYADLGSMLATAIALAAAIGGYSLGAWLGIRWEDQVTRLRRHPPAGVPRRAASTR